MSRLDRHDIAAIITLSICLFALIGSALSLMWL